MLFQLLDFQQLTIKVRCANTLTHKTCCWYVDK